MQTVLLLNAGFEPLRIVSWQRAFALVCQQKVEILEQYETVIRTVSHTYRVPAVLKLREWVNLKRRPPIIRFSRANVYARDGYRCQYCCELFAERELTLDHVFPAVRGGRKTWENIVAACRRCNQRKGDRTPTEAKMELLRDPAVPRWLPGEGGGPNPATPPEQWTPYLGANWPGLRSLIGNS